MTVLVTGGCGYIGSHMVWNLHDAGDEVVIVDNLTTGFRNQIPGDVKVYVGDVADQELIKKVITDNGITAIIHFAGSIVVPESVTNPLDYYSNNTVKSRALIESAVKGNVPHFIFSSTAAVYGNPANADKPIQENCELAPISPYGSSKLMTEIMLRDCAAAYGLQYAALRYFNVAGADPQGRTGQSTAEATHLIKVTNQVALGMRTHLDVFGTDYPTDDGTCIRDYIHVSDLVNAHACALKALRDGQEAFVANVGYGKGSSVLDVVEAVKKQSNAALDVRLVERRAGDPARLVADSSRLKTITGWKPEHDDLNHIVKTALDWERRLMDKS